MYQTCINGCLDFQDAKVVMLVLRVTQIWDAGAVKLILMVTQIFKVLRLLGFRTFINKMWEHFIVLDFKIFKFVHDKPLNVYHSTSRERASHQSTLIYRLHLSNSSSPRKNLPNLLSTFPPHEFFEVLPFVIGKAILRGNSSPLSSYFSFL